MSLRSTTIRLAPGRMTTPEGWVAEAALIVSHDTVIAAPRG
jgi:hypothetical protein